MLRRLAARLVASPGRARPALAGRGGALPPDRPPPDAAPGVLVLPDRHRARFRCSRRCSSSRLLHRRAPVHGQPAPPRGHGRRRVGRLRPARDLPAVAVGADGKVTSSDVAWLPAGAPGALDRGGSRGPASSSTATTALARRPDGEAARRPAAAPRPLGPAARPGSSSSRTARATRSGVEAGEASRRRTAGITIDEKPTPRREAGSAKILEPRRAAGPAGAPCRRGQGLRGAASGSTPSTSRRSSTPSRPKAEDGTNVAVLTATTSPRPLVDQLFAQGVDGDRQRLLDRLRRHRRRSLLFVYLVALAIAFVLVGSIARNVNRLTRATAGGRPAATSRCGSSSKSRDQIGDLARSFDGMADSIQSSCAETAEKERLESEIAIARTIQHKLLPPPEAQPRRASRCSPTSSRSPRSAATTTTTSRCRTAGRRSRSATSPATACRPACSSPWPRPASSTLARGRAPRRRALRAAERPDPPLDGPAALHDARPPRLRPGDARAARSPTPGQLAPYRISGGRRRGRSRFRAFPLGLFPGPDVPVRAEYAFAAGDLARLLHATASSRRSTRTTRPFGFERFEAVLRAHAAARRPGPPRRASSRPSRAHAGGRAADDDRTLLILTLA